MILGAVPTVVRVPFKTVVRDLNRSGAMSQLLVSDELWTLIEPLLPRERAKPSWAGTAGSGNGPSRGSPAFAAGGSG
jgi:hypothetical protein